MLYSSFLRVLRAQRLRDAGKPFKVILTAAMRKLLVTLNQMVKTDTTYDPKLVASIH